MIGIVCVLDKTRRKINIVNNKCFRRAQIKLIILQYVFH